MHIYPVSLFFSRYFQFLFALSYPRFLHPPAFLLTRQGLGSLTAAGADGAHEPAGAPPPEAASRVDHRQGIGRRGEGGGVAVAPGHTPASGGEARVKGRS